MKFLILLILILYLLAGSAHALVSDIEYPVDISDEQLRELAVRNGIIPAEAGQEYVTQQILKQNTTNAWLAMIRQDKIDVVGMIIEIFRDKDGAIVSLPSEFYVDTLNAFLFDSIIGDEKYLSDGKGLGAFLKTIVVMEGDFDDGTNKEDLLKQQIGEETAQGYKERQPEKYEALFE